MSVLDQFVEVYITRQTTQIDTASFNIPLILSTHDAFSERARVYSGIESIKEDFPVGSTTYTIAQQLYGQQLKPVSVVVGRREADYQTGTIGAVAAAPYTITVGGEDYTYTAIVSDTLTTIVNGLNTLLEPEKKVKFVVTDAATGKFTLTKAVVDVVVEYTANITTVEVMSNETYAEAFAEVLDENSEWYAMVADTTLDADILALAAAVQATEKIYFASSPTAALYDPASITDVGFLLFNANYDRTSLIFSEKANIEFPEAAWLWQLQEVPGSNNWALKSMAGVSASKLSPNKVTALANKKVNYIQKIVGATVIMNGTMASGEWIDTIIFIDWLKARLQEQIFYRMINTKKIPFDTVGVTIVENEIRTILDLGVTNGGIAQYPAYTVQSPNVLSILEVQRAARTLGDFTFTARLAGAVNKVIIRGVVGY